MLGDADLEMDVAEATEFYRIDAVKKLDPSRRSLLGQFMTPTPIARYMTSLFGKTTGEVRLLDPGAGVGSLTASFVENICSSSSNLPDSVLLSCCEIEPVLLDYLQATLQVSADRCQSVGVKVSTEVNTEDFILSYTDDVQLDAFSRSKQQHSFTHVILNPPYKKISNSSNHRIALQKAGLETSNLYTGFMYLSALRLCHGGEMVAIVPRSFCNGPYFKPFREKFFSLMTLKHVHVFESRQSAFKGDDVLQENIIIHAVKGAKRDKVKITTCRGGDFHLDAGTGECVAEDMSQRTVPYSSVINPTDRDGFVHIAVNDIEQRIINRISQFQRTLSDIGVEVSTGPVVDFRHKPDLRQDPTDTSAPLLYSSHFKTGSLEWPKDMKKPNAIEVTEDSRRWLWRNKGHFVVTRRFSSKEEKRRIVASLYSSEISGEFVGFENHLNVFHSKKNGLSKNLAVGLTTFLNSSLVDKYFRQFNGHTQVNATDLKSMRYPAHDVLEKLGRHVSDRVLSQNEIDTMLEGELVEMAEDENPILTQSKIDEALEIVKALGMPKGQQNERSALTLLALLDCKPTSQWQGIAQPLMGITPIMGYCREHYGREYAPNTRETFRRQTMHQFVEAGIAVYNPDDPSRPVNSPKACYQVSDEAFEVIKTYGADGWENILATYLEGQETLAAKWAKHREMQMIPVQIAEGQEIALTPGIHSLLIKDIIDEFAPRFAPASEVIYVGDTGQKVGHFESSRLAELGVTVDQHGKMPDVVLYFGQKDWLLLIESVTSHGPVDAKRHNELAELFADSSPGLVYVTAFPDRKIMGKYLSEISWETEVWCADSPSHLIHFNGERFLGPYEA